MPSYSCPVCQQVLKPQERQWRCQQGHSYDQAKEGYLNLLLANKKKTQNPGDNAEMMTGRRQFLESGAYQFLPNHLIELIASNASELKVTEALDLGSGEGFYTDQLQKGLPDYRWSGVDISKQGVRMAAKKYKDCRFAVASTYELPYLKKSQALAIQIFSPASVDEVCRVLAPEGLYAVVNPAPKHLWGLKQHLYDEPKEHETSVLNDSRLQLVSEEVISEQLIIEDSGQLQDLFVMTPFFWNVGKERQEELKGIDHLETEVAFHVALYRREKDAPIRYWESAEKDSSTG